MHRSRECERRQTHALPRLRVERELERERTAKDEVRKAKEQKEKEIRAEQTRELKARRAAVDRLQKLEAEYQQMIMGEVEKFQELKQNVMK